MTDKLHTICPATTGYVLDDLIKTIHHASSPTLQLRAERAWDRLHPDHAMEREASWPASMVLLGKDPERLLTILRQAAQQCAHMMALSCLEGQALDDVGEVSDESHLPFVAWDGDFSRRLQLASKASAAIILLNVPGSALDANLPVHGAIVLLDPCVSINPSQTNGLSGLHQVLSRGCRVVWTQDDGRVVDQVLTNHEVLATELCDAWAAIHDRLDLPDPDLGPRKRLSLREQIQALDTLARDKDQ